MAEKTTTKTNTVTKNIKRLKGVVVSDKGDKTVVVAVKRYAKLPKYGKYMNITKRYKVHDPENTKKLGEEVIIESCRPISKDKKFKVIN